MAAVSVFFFFLSLVLFLCPHTDTRFSSSSNMAHVDAKYRALYTRLRDSLSDFTAEQVRRGERKTVRELLPRVSRGLACHAPRVYAHTTRGLHQSG
jgi:hypothetical protein